MKKSIVVLVLLLSALCSSLYAQDYQPMSIAMLISGSPTVSGGGGGDGGTPGFWDGLTNTINDDFNRGTGIGANWSSTTVAGWGNLTIVSSTYVQAGSATYEMMSWTGSLAADQYAQVSLTTALPDSGAVLVLVRSDSTASNTYLGLFNRVGSTYSIYIKKTISGTFQAALASATTTSATMGLRIGVSGSDLELQTYNGSAWSTVLTATDTAIATGKPGIGVASTASVDDFAAGTL